MKLKAFVISAMTLAMAFCVTARGQRYCNPLPMPIGQGGNAGGDVTVLEEGGNTTCAAPAAACGCPTTC